MDASARCLRQWAAVLPRAGPAAPVRGRLGGGRPRLLPPPPPRRLLCGWAAAAAAPRRLNAAASRPVGSLTEDEAAAGPGPGSSSSSSSSSVAESGPAFAFRVADVDGSGRWGRLDAYLAEMLASPAAADASPASDDAAAAWAADGFGDAEDKYADPDGAGGAAANRAAAVAALAASGASASRAKLQAAVRAGLVRVNGRPQTKPSYVVRPGDRVECRLAAAAPMHASPEAIPLRIVFEDDHVIVVNKPAGMVVHPAPGNYSGTLVNALLYHLGLPAVPLEAPAGVGGPAAAAAAAAGRAGGGLLRGGGAGGRDGLEGEDADWDEEDAAAGPALGGGGGGGRGVAAALPAALRAGPVASVRPGIVHRLDKGTSGLLVVAKTDAAHAGLCAQFKARSVQRIYVSITSGVPASPAGGKSGRVEAAVGRDPRDRKRMSVVLPGARGSVGRPAASRWEAREALAGGGAALVLWKLETGRTHQIRVHAAHLGTPLLGDETYGLGQAAAAAALAAAPGAGALSRPAAAAALAALGPGRPALHAATLGFAHPASGAAMHFSADLPADFEAMLAALRSGGSGGQELGGTPA